MIISSWPRRYAAVPAVVLAALAVVLSPAAPAHADSDAVPTYEVKIDLTTAALDASHEPTAAVKAAFGITGSAKPRAYAYFDTGGQELNAQGWDVRLRHKSGDDFEETYKKRFPISDGDIDAALDEANDEGFDSGDTNYACEVDWGYSRQTLSFSNDKSHNGDDYSGTSMPSASTGLGWLVDEIPGKLQDWGSAGWGEDTLQEAGEYGPVTSEVYSGAWESSDDASIEVLPVVGADGTGTDYVVELSLKTDDYADAAQLHTDAVSVARSHGWLYAGDILKTQLILDRY